MSTASLLSLREAQGTETSIGTFDIAVVGGGPAGYAAAIEAAATGARVALVEREQLGGTCVAKGCIPTKALQKTAEIALLAAEAAAHGFDLELRGFDLSIALSRAAEATRRLSEGIALLLDRRGVTRYAGTARITGPGEITVTGPAGLSTLRAGHVLVATGSTAATPDIPGATDPLFGSSDDVLRLEALPHRVVILGAGIVGLEFASIFSALGASVTVVEVLAEPLPALDAEVVHRLLSALRRRGVRVVTGATPLAVERAPDGVELVVLAGGNTKKPVRHGADWILHATGRRPNTAGLGLDELGVTRQPGGAIPVAGNQETALPWLYAAGDATGPPFLAHLAEEEGVRAARAALGLSPTGTPRHAPAVLYSLPELGWVGLSEAQARAAGADVTTGRCQLAANGKAVARGEIDGMVKVVADSGGRILGVHVLGPHAGDLVAEATLAMEAGLSLADVTATVHAHPTLPEAFAEACRAAAGRPRHTLPTRPGSTG